MSYHWTSNGTANNLRLKPWLDPTNSGVLTLAGSTNPCSSSTGPCTTSVSGVCDEYIQNVLLNTINSTTACTSGGYASYLTTTTSLAKGAQYTATITPGTSYNNDEIAIWIDYNNDFIFSTTERVGYVLVSTSTAWSNQFTFTVPLSAIVGLVRMRVRISYNGTGGNGGAPIDPCAIATYGETEDYTVNITTSGVGLSENDLSAITIYPNPSSDILNIDLSSANEEVQSIFLVDITGKLIQTIDVLENTNISLNVSSLASGLYHLMISSASNSIVRQVVKE